MLPKRVLITGAHGQVGSALLDSAPLAVVVHGVGRADLDISDPQQVQSCMAAFRPDIVINAAAYTAVDRAEDEQDVATRVNVTGPANLARSASECGSRLIHISTDFVFDGKASVPYRTEDIAAPINTYGRTKLAGERQVTAILGDKTTIVRTAWVYAATGRNFLRTMLRLMKERGQVSVVSDQIGTPTSSTSLARALWALAARPEARGLFHWTDAGVATWYDFAVAIAEEAAARGLTSPDVRVMPIPTSEYPTPAKRPAYSVLDTRDMTRATGESPVHWRKQLRIVMNEIQAAT